AREGSPARARARASTRARARHRRRRAVASAAVEAAGALPAPTARRTAHLPASRRSGSARRATFHRPEDELLDVQPAGGSMADLPIHLPAKSARRGRPISEALGLARHLLDTDDAA